jgi:hypothetical protein
VPTFALFSLSRWQHGPDRGPDKRLLRNPSQPPLRYLIRYDGDSLADARRHFLADHSIEDVAEWLDLLMWVDSLYHLYAGYILYQDETQTQILQKAFQRRDKQGRYVKGEGKARTVRQERRRIAHALAQQLLEIQQCLSDSKTT